MTYISVYFIPNGPFESLAIYELDNLRVGPVFSIVVARNVLYFVRDFGCRMSRVVILIKSFRFLELIRLHVNHLTTSSHCLFEHFQQFPSNKNVLKTLNMTKHHFHTKNEKHDYFTITSMLVTVVKGEMCEWQQ